MSSLMQFHTGAVADAVTPPAVIWNGIPHESDGDLAIDGVSAIDHYHAGLPYTAAGRLATGAAPVTRFGSGAAPFNAAGRLVVLGDDTALSFLAAVGYGTGSGAIGGIATGGGVSSQVQAVFDRMSALTQTEKDAIETYVNGMVADGIYSNITEIYAPCLNATDFRTGFKFQTAIQSGTPPVHTPGQYIDFTTGSQHWLDSADFDTFATVDGMIAAYIVLYNPDVTANSDLFGLATAGVECYMRWRGNDTNDFNAIYNVTAATPRTAANVRPTGDLVGFGLDGVDVFNLQPGGIVVKATRVPVANVPAGNPLQWHGQNIDGVPSIGNVQNSRYSLMIMGNTISDTNAVQIRARSLQFLKDIGVTGVP